MPAKKVLLSRCGQIDPDDIKSHLAVGGFEALDKARAQMTPAEVILEVKASGLRGRGGAGFPCGAKWEAAACQGGAGPFLICNADEGEVGTFKDRYILEHDPFTFLEGLAIAAYALGAARSFIYLRHEYRWLLPRLENALDQARAQGFLDGLTVEVVLGAGAYVCGEESALMDSIEGRRGEPRYKPPYPTVKGLWQRPTVINNVETLMNLPFIIARGHEWYAKLGTGRSTGTKLFCLSGDVPKPGVYELVLGSTLGELVQGLGGALDVKLVQVGGAVGRILPAERLDTPLSYEGALGSGAVMVLDSTRSVISLLQSQFEFLAHESCGKCAPCRVGTECMLEILTRINEMDGAPEDLEALRRLAQAMASSSLCGLGQGAPVPINDALEFFGPELQERINQSLALRRAALPFPAGRGA